MTRQEFIDMLSLYKGVEVQFSESNKYVSITLTKYTDTLTKYTDYWGGGSPEVGFYWGEQVVYVSHTDGLEPEALLQLSYVLKLVYEYLQKGTWK